MENSVLTGFSKTKLVFLLSILMNILRLVLIPVFSIFDVNGIVISYGLAFFLSFLLGFVLLLPRVVEGYRLSLSFDSKGLMGIWRFSLASFFARILNGIPSALLPFLVLYFISEEVSAYFFIPWMISGTFTVATRAVGTSLLVEGASSPNSFRSNFRTAFFLVEGAALAFTALIILQGNLILNLFGSDYSSVSLSLLTILALSSFFVGFNSLYYEVLRLRDHLVIAVLSQIVIAVGIILWSIIFLPQWGITTIGSGWFFLNLSITILASGELIFSRLFTNRRDQEDELDLRIINQ